MIELVGIGACVLDKLIVVDHYPAEDVKQEALSSDTAGGGPTATAIVAAAKLGAKAAFVGVLSKDDTGEALLKDFSTYGVDNSYITLAEGRGFASWILLNQATGSRTCVYDRGDLPDLKLDKRQKEVIRNAKLLEIDGNNLPAALEACDLIHERGGEVLYDADGRYPGVEALLPKTDYLIPSEEFARFITGEDDLLKAAHILFERYSPKAVVITAGKEGGVYLTAEEEGRYPCFKVETKDTNGAGDVFHGAFSAAILREMTVREACVYSSATSAIKCTGIGARRSAPGHEEVMEFLKEQQK